MQGRSSLRTKLIIGADPSLAVLEKVLQGSSPWGRGRIAQLCNELAPPLGSDNPLQVHSLLTVH
jgi:hypothetical protein